MSLGGRRIDADRPLAGVQLRTPVWGSRVSRRRARHTTVPSAHPPRGAVRPRPPKQSSRPRRRGRHSVARIVDETEASLLDIVDNLLNKGVVLNADLILALADVDLVYIRLSALLCAADRLIPKERVR